MEITLKDFPVKVVNIPWRNNNLSNLNTDPPLSEQGETFIGVYLLVLGKLTILILHDCQKHDVTESTTQTTVAAHASGADRHLCPAGRN